MKIIKISDVEGVELGEGQKSIGKITYKNLIDEKVSKSFWSFYASFPPGQTSGVHAHNTEQILYFTEGRGVVGTDKEEHEVTAGTLVLIPAGQSHYHGATSTSACAHLAVILEGPGAPFKKMLRKGKSK